MSIRTTISSLLASLLLTFLLQSANACSMYKVTADGKTMVGCNEDAWRTTSKIWFVNSVDENGIGACFTGSRKVGKNKFAPQSGMNVEGLVFSRLVAYHPVKNIDQTDKKHVPNEVEYLTDILQKCKTIAEVKRYIEQYDHSIFIDDVFIYIDKSGDYLIVEPYQLIEGNDPSYVLANFCPSLTSNQEARKQTKYKNGEDYLKQNGIDTSLGFCRSVSDAMHVSRKRNGDGTLLTSIWDTQNGLVNLYFYHSYESTIQFDLKKELALGDHIIDIPGLFPTNHQFQRLIDYKTPFNVNLLRGALAFIGVFIFFLAFIYLISYFRKRKTEKLNLIKLIFAGLNVFLFGYLFIIATNIHIFYFDAPFQFHDSALKSMSSYIPFLLFLFFIPITIYTFRYVKMNGRSKIMKSILVFNNIIYFVLIIGFRYWGLINIFY